MNASYFRAGLKTLQPLVGEAHTQLACGGFLNATFTRRGSEYLPIRNVRFGR